MLGELTAGEIEQVLRRQQFGRLGVAGDGRVYIFPISYGYDGAFIYAVSQLGLKVQLMRKNPEVCFEVEEIESPARWRTVMAHGTFEELWDEAERDHAFAQIADQGTLAPLSLAPYTGHMETLVVYRIRIAEKTGRFEQDDVLRAARAGAR
jgi:uncharacterized protein